MDKKTIQFIFDLETSGLPVNSFGVIMSPDGKYTPMDIDVVRRMYSDVDIYQFGITNNKNGITHISSVPPSREAVQEALSKTFTGFDNIAGNRTKVSRYTTRTMEHNELMSFLSKGGKLKDSQVQGYMDSVGQTILKKATTVRAEVELGGRRINTSNFSLTHLAETGEYVAGESPLQKRITNKLGDYAGLKIDHRGVVPAEDFLGTGKNSLFEQISGIVNTKAVNPIEIAGWNVGFDIEGIRAVLDRTGKTELLKQFDMAVADGSIVLRGIEHEWQNLVYRLVQENPEMRSAFKIRYTPTAFRETGGRSGRTFGTFEEFLYSTNKWTQQHVAQVFGFTKEIQKAMPLGIEEHVASLDVGLTKATKDVFNKLLDFINEDLRKQNKQEIKSLSELRRLKNDDKLVSRAFDKLIKRDKDSVIKGLSKEEVFESIVKPAREFAEYEAKTFGSSYARAITKINHTSNLVKYGVPLGLGAAALYATFGFGTDERDDTFMNKIPNVFNVIRGLFDRDFRKGRVNDDAERRTHVLKTMAMATAFPLVALWGVGYTSSIARPNYFGTHTKPINTLGDFAQSFFRTVLYGTKKVEEVFPITKIARAGDMAEYMFGDKTYGRLPDGKWKGKRFQTIGKIGSKGKVKVLNRFEHGVGIEDLIDAGRVTLGGEEFEALHELLNPTAVPEGVTRRIPMISIDEKGRAVVFGEEFGKAFGSTEEVRLLDTDMRKLWKKGITIDANISIHELRHTARATGEKTSNAIGYLKLQRELIERGYVNKASIEEVMRKQGIEAAEGTLKYAEEFVKYALEIGPKGVGEASNILFDKAQELAFKSQTLIHIKNLTGKHAWSSENAKFMTKFVGPIVQNYTIEGMNNFLERPFEFLVPNFNKKLWDTAKSLKSSDNVVSQLTGKALSFIAAPHLGLPMYNIKGGMAGYIGEFAVKRILPAYLGFEALRFTDHVLGAITMSPTGRGPLTMAPIKAWETLSLAYNKLSDITGLTAVAKKQESVAPGSTSLGIFAPAASLTATFALGAAAYKLSPHNIQASFKNLAVDMLKRGGNENVLIKGLNREIFSSRSPFQKMLSWAIDNPKRAIFALGMIPAIPFLPGFLGSNKTYEERKAEFRGKKEVAIRKNRGWLLSTSPFEGGRVTHFREHALSLIEKDWENRGVVWPSYWKRFAHNITGGLYGRYMLEEYHKDSQPVYQSAPYGANIPVIGPLISGTIGRWVKPTIDYHKYGLEWDDNQDGVGALVLQNLTGSKSKVLRAYATGGGLSRGAMQVAQLDTTQLAQHIGLQSENSGYSASNKFARSIHDFMGFRGFAYETMKSAITGLKTPDEFTPYAQSASEFYNTSQQMWAYQAGDVGLFSGEFLRRIFQYPDRRWTVNNIKNEFSGVSWIPQGGKDVGKSSSKDLTRGTTFDKVPMGWLHATRKGFEFQFPEVKGLDFEQYPDPVRVEILKHMSPFSGEFNAAASRVKDLAIGNQLTPEQEQRYYESLQQVGQLKDQLYADDSQASYHVSTQTVEGRIQDVDDTGRFTLDSMPGRTFKLSGVSLQEEDIRARLLRERQFEDQYELSSAMRSVVEDTKKIMQDNLHVGRKVSLQVAAMDQMMNPNMDVEAVMGSLNTMLIDKGAGFVNTGNLAKYNVFQQLNGLPSRLISRYWEKLSGGESFFINKLKPKRDYLSHYKYSNVYNRDVKMWNKPIEQIIKPMIASTLHKFGIDTIPQFTITRRRNQEYWDILKYIKGKMLENKTGNPMYRDMWKSTMIGADPIHGTHEELLRALPENEKAFFSRFANEPNAKKRGQILKYIPAAQRRIYIALWSKQQHAAAIKETEKEKEFWENVRDTEGFGMSKEEENQWRRETGGHTSRADWKRLKYIEEYAESHYIPDADDEIWRENVDIDNVELLSLKSEGHNTEDYGFFEDKARIAAYDSTANLVALHMKSKVLTMSSSVGSLTKYISSDYNAKEAQSHPSMTINPLLQNNIQTNGYQKLLEKNYTRYAAEMLDDVVMIALRR